MPIGRLIKLLERTYGDPMPQRATETELDMDKDTFRIEWDLHELGPRPAYETPLHTSARLDFARALALGDVPANAPQIDDEEQAA
jgi:hypothetical protein